MENQIHTHEFGEKCPVCTTGEIIQKFTTKKKLAILNAIVGPAGKSTVCTHVETTPPHCESCKIVFYREIDPEELQSIEQKLLNLAAQQMPDDYFAGH
jgi:hypothetical protein